MIQPAALLHRGCTTGKYMFLFDTSKCIHVTTQAMLTVRSLSRKSGFVKVDAHPRSEDASAKELCLEHVWPPPNLLIESDTKVPYILGIVMAIGFLGAVPVRMVRGRSKVQNIASLDRRGPQPPLLLDVLSAH